MERIEVSATPLPLAQPMPSKLFWFAVLVPTLAVFGFESVRHSYLEGLLPTGVGNLLAAAFVAAGSAVFVRVLHRMTTRTMQALQEERAAAASLRERQALAADLHDGILQTFFFLRVYLEQADRALAAGDAAGARPQLAAVLRTLTGETQRLRGMLARLSAPPAEPRDLALWIEENRDEFSRLAGVPVDIRSRLRRHPSCRISERSATEVEAILREALVNVRRHAHAGGVRLDLESAGDGVVLQVTDDGCGFRPVAVTDGGMGLAIMRQRAARIGARLDVNGEERPGTRLRLTLPAGITKP